MKLAMIKTQEERRQKEASRYALWMTVFWILVILGSIAGVVIVIWLWPLASILTLAGLLVVGTLVGAMGEPMQEIYEHYRDKKLRK
jgi:predicted benzoate:H+ symporter BenE